MPYAPGPCTDHLDMVHIINMVRCILIWTMYQEMVRGHINMDHIKMTPEPYQCASYLYAVFTLSCWAGIHVLNSKFSVHFSGRSVA